MLKGLGFQLTDKVQGSPGNLTPRGGGKAWRGRLCCPLGNKAVLPGLGSLGLLRRGHCQKPSFTNSSWVTLPADLASDISLFTDPRGQVCREEPPCPQ